MSSYLRVPSWFGVGPPTPKRSSTLQPRPLTPKLTTPITEYPPHNLTTDSQWEHVKHGSPPSPETDEMAFERLGYSQIDGPLGGVPGDFQRGGGGVSVPVPQQVLAKEEGDRRLRQQLETSLAAAQRKVEPERASERLDRKVAELKANGRSERDREKDGSSSSSRSRRERERERERDSVAAAPISLTDTLKEENDKLKAMIQQQVQQLNQAQEEMRRERSRLEAEAERLKKELDVSGGAHKEELEEWKKSLQEHAQRIDYLSTDCERLRKDRDSVATKLTAEIERLKQKHAKETEETKAQIDQVNHDHALARSELRKVRKSLDDYAPKLDESLGEIERLRRELANAKEYGRAAAELKHRLEMQTRDLEIARNQSSTLKKEFDQLMTLLDDRTSELKGAQSFLTTADSFSGAEVTNTLQRLNTEVLQSTAFMAESMVDTFFPEGPTRGSGSVSKTEDQIAGSRRASAMIGGVIVHFLGTKNHKDDPILIQIAFQAYLAYHLRWIACAWIVGGDEDHNKFVDALYQSVREREAQAIAGRWRALTRANVPSTPFDQSQLTITIANKMISGLCDILLAAGCTSSKSDITAALSSKFTDKLSLLVSLAIRVNKIVGEDVTSGDLEVLAVPPATTFDATWMEDSYDDGSASKARELNTPKVLCATDLGLRKKTRVAMTGEKEKQWEIKVLLKPKVALESVIEIMDE